MNARLETTQRATLRPARRQVASVYAGLPKLDRVPTRISLRPERAEWASLALWCDDAGLVKPHHWKSAYNAEAVVLAALSDWATRNGRFDRLACSLSIQLAEGEQDFAWDWAALLEARGLDPDRPHLAVTTWGASSRSFTVGRVLNALECECPGLGRTALHDLREAAIRTVDVMDPARAFYLASMFYWYGEPDETEVIEEIGGEEEAGDYIVRRSQFDDYAPEWAWIPRKALSVRALQAITRNTGLSGCARQVAATCLALRRAGRKFRAFGAYEGLNDLDFIGHGALLWWDTSDHDPMVRILDDYEQNVMQGGEAYSDSFGIEIFEASPDGFKGWLAHKKQWFALAHKLDTLVGLIGEEVGHESN